MLAFGYIVIIKRDGRDGSSYPVTTQTCTIGRGISSDVRIHVQSVSEEHCKIFTTDFGPALLRNLSNTSTTLVNGVSIGESESPLEHGDIITTGDRSFRWEYLSDSPYYLTTIRKNNNRLSTSPLRGSTGMVGMPISVLQSALGHRPFHRRSLVGTESKRKSSPLVMTSPGQTSAKTSFSVSKRVLFTPSERLVAIVSPQRRSQSNKKVIETVTEMNSNRDMNCENEGTSTSLSSDTPVIIQHTKKSKISMGANAGTIGNSPTEKSITELSNLSSTKRLESTPLSRKSNRLFTKSAKKVASSNIGVKMFYNRRSLQALVSTRTPRQVSKARKSAAASLSTISNTLARSKSSTPKTPQSRVDTPKTPPSKVSTPKTPRSKVSTPKTPPSKESTPKTSRSKVSTRKTPRSRISTPKTPRSRISTPKTPRSRISIPKTPRSKISTPKTPRLKVSTPKTSRSLKKSNKSTGSHKIKSPLSTGGKTKARIVQKTPVVAVIRNQKRKLESGLRSAERAAKRLKLETPKTPDKKKMAALLVCHGKASRSKTPQSLSNLAHVRHASLERMKSTPVVALKSRESVVRKTAKKKSEILQSTNTETSPIKDIYSLDIPKEFKFNNEGTEKNVSFGRTSSRISNSPFKSLSNKRQSLRPTVGGTASPKLDTTHMSGTAELFSSPVPMMSTRQTATPASANTQHISVSPSEEVTFKKSYSSRISAISLSTHMPNVTPVQIVISDRKTSKLPVNQSLFEGLMRKSLQSKPLYNESTDDEEKPQTPLIRRSKSMSSRKSRLDYSAFSDHANNSSSRKSVSSRTAKQSPEFVYHSSSAGRTLSPIDPECTSKSLTPLNMSSVNQSSSSRMLRYVSIPESSVKAESVPSSSTPFSKQSTSSNKSRNSRVVVEFSSFIDQDSSSSSLIGSPKSSECVQNKMMSPISTSVSKRISSPRKYNSISGSLSSSVAELDSTSSRIRQLSNRLSKSSGKSTIQSGNRLSRSRFSSIQPPKGVLLEESMNSLENKKVGSLKKRVSWSHSTSPDSQNTTFDFDSVKTPHITLEDLVSPLSFSRKRRSKKLQNMSEQKIKSEYPLKRRRLSERTHKNVDVSIENSVKLLTPQQLFSLSLSSNESTNTSKASVKRWELSNKLSNNRASLELDSSNASPANDHSVVKRLRMLKSPTKNPINVSSERQLVKKLRSPKSSKNDQTDVREVRQLVKTPKIPKSPKNDLTDVRGVRQLLKTPKSPKSPKNELTDVRGVRQLMKTPKSPKSPKNDLRDVRGVKQLMKTPRNQKSPKNDLRDVRGVRQIMRTPRILKSPKNDLRDVRGVKQLMSPKTSKSPKNDLTNVCGVRKLMETPRPTKSPNNDLTDVRGVRRLMTTPRIAKSPKNDLTDIQGVKELMRSPNSPKSWNVDNYPVKTHLSPKFDGNVSPIQKLTPSDKTTDMSKSDVNEVALSKRTRRMKISSNLSPSKHSPKSIKMEEDATEIYDQKQYTRVSQEIKINTTRNRRNRKVPDSPTVKPATEERSPKSPVKTRRQKKKIIADFSTESVGTSVTSSGEQNRVQFDLEAGPDISTPVIRVTRRRRGVDLKAVIKIGDSPISPIEIKKDKDTTLKTNLNRANNNKGQSDGSSSLSRKTRGGKVVSEVELPSTPKRKRGEKATAEIASPSSPKRKRDISVTVETELPIPAKRRRGVTNINVSSPKRGHGVVSDNLDSLPTTRRRGTTINVDVEPSPSRTRRGVTLKNNSADLSSPPKKQRGKKVTAVELHQSPVSKKTRGKATVKTSSPITVELHQSPVAKKIRGKATVKILSPSISTSLNLEDSPSTSDKHSKTKDPEFPAPKRGKHSAKEVKPSTSPAVTRRLRSAKSSVDSSGVSGETMPATTKTKSRKTRVIASPVAKSPTSPLTGKRSKRQLQKLEESPVAQPKTRSRRK